MNQASITYHFLGGVVVHAQLGDHLGGIQRRVDGQSLGNHKQCLAELGNGQLLTRTQRGREGLEVDGQRCLDSTTPSHLPSERAHHQNKCRCMGT